MNYSQQKSSDPRVRRTRSGALDHDYYDAQARRLRSQALKELPRRLGMRLRRAQGQDSAQPRRQN